MIRIIAGTNRPGNISAALASEYAGILTHAGAESAVFSLSELPPDVIVSDLYGKRSEAFTPIQEWVSTADKFIFVVPEYNGSLPGVLKVFLDACQYPDSFLGKKAAMVGISAGRGGNRSGLDHLSDILGYLRMEVLPDRVHIPRIRQKMSREGFSLSEEETEALRRQAEHFIRF